MFNLFLINQKETKSEAIQVGLYGIFVYAICLTLFINIAGVDPVDYLILTATFLGFPYALRTFRKIWKRKWHSFLILLFLFSYLVSLMFGGGSISFVVNFFINVFLLIIFISYCTTPKRLREIIFYLSAGFLLSTFISLIQILGFIAGISVQFDVVRNARYMGLFGDPNLLGISTVFFILYWFDYLIVKYDKSIVYNIFAIVVVYTAVIVLINTQSRSAWGAGVLAMIVYIFISFRILSCRAALRVAGFWALFVSSIIIGLQVTGGAGIIESRIETSIQMQSSAETDQMQSSAEKDRLSMRYTRIALGVVANNPLGVGPGNAAESMEMLSHDGKPIGAHNVFVQVILENGWIAGLSFILLIFSLFVSVYKFTFIGEVSHVISGRVLAATFFAIIFFGLFQDLVQWKNIWVIPALYIAVLLNDI
jgi:O-antigen ligase